MRAPQDAVNGGVGSDAPQLVFDFRPGSSECDPARKDILGGKGASLAAMSRAGFPVPPGFTISAECCQHVEVHGAWPNGLEPQVRAALQRLESHTQRTFGRAPRPLLVAVRSGAAVSMPGMMDTILNCGLNPSLIGCFASPALFWHDYAEHIRIFAASVAGLSLKSSHDDAEARSRAWLTAYQQETRRPFPIDPWDALAQSINAVFASWHSPRAQAYRRHHDVRGVPGTAVNVQAMFPSQRSGVLFTAHPNDLRAGQMVLEASWGLGEAVVSGAVTPDIYVLDATTLAVTSMTPGDRPGNEPALSDEQILELGRLGQQVEKYFGVPSDIEWGLADGKLVLLQARPIRGLDIIQDVERGRLEEIARLKQVAGREHVVWVAHNLGETLPTPTPLTWDIVRWFMSGRGGFGQLYRTLGYQPSKLVDDEGFLELICGHIYTDPRSLAGLFWRNLPLEYRPDEILANPRVLDGPPQRMNFQNADPFLFARLPGLVWSMLRCTRRMKRLRAGAVQLFEQQALPMLESYLENARNGPMDGGDLAAYDTSYLPDILRRRAEYVLGKFAAESLLPGFFAGLAQQELTTWLTRLMGHEGQEYVQCLTSGLDGDVTVEQNVELHRVARGETTLETFLERFGHRAANEMELAQPRWREDASFLQRMIDSFRAEGAVSPAERHGQQAAVRREAEAALPSTLTQFGGSCFRERIEALLRETQGLLPCRELGKFHLMRGYETLRQVIVELGRRFDLGRDVFFLRWSELKEFTERESELREAVEKRKLRWKSAQKLVLNEIIDSHDLDSLGLPAAPAAESARRLPARPIASGAAAGIARVVFDPGEARDLGADYILVCPSTDPGWTPLFLHARGLVVERGGVLSHGAIVARDFGIPAVVCEHATRLIPDRSRIQLDAHRGEIVLCE
jgi:phosphohistidine swiveling domain-containing protein